MVSDNKRIAKNTIFLYVRMLIIMVVTLYTSRVVLDKLGVVDYGLYGVVGGVVGMLSFLNATLTSGTSRFITYELGTENKERLWRTFNTSFFTHLCLSIIVLAILETAGLWFFFNKLIIPDDRLDACFVVYQLSLLTTFINISQVPYNSLVQSHEDFDIYAYVSLFEAFSKLVICYCITISNYDKLILYAFLIAAIQFVIAMFYLFYCNKRYEESHLSFSFDREIFKGLMGFSGWNLVANLTHTLRLQGVVILINMFLSPVVVAAQTIANQVCNAAMGFVNNFRTAFNPQIIKLYAAGEKEESKKLTLRATIISFDMVLLLALPCIYTMPTIMQIWLVEVPDYAVIFTQCMLICNVIDTFNSSFYTPMLAANKIKFNSISAVFIGIGQFILLYFVLKSGGGPLWVPIFSIVIIAIYSLIIKPYVLWKNIEYTISELLSCYWDCLKVLILSLLATIPLVCILGNGIWQSAIIIIVTIIVISINALLFMERAMRNKFIGFIRSKLYHK